MNEGEGAVFTFPGGDRIWAQLRALQKADKTRRTRMMRQTMTHAAYYAGIKKDLASSASRGEIGRYLVALKMYEETIVEVQGRDYWQGLVNRGAAGWERYKAQGHFLSLIPF